MVDEQLCLQLFEHSPDGLFLVDANEEGCFVFSAFNPALEKIVGIGSAAIEGRFVNEGLPPLATPASQEQLLRCLDASAPFTYEESLHLPAGESFFSITLIPLRNDQGWLYRVIGIMRDITALKQAQDLRHLSELSLQTPAGLSSAETTMARYAPDCTLVYANPAVGRVVGVPVETLIGKKPTEHAFLPAAAAYEESLRTVFNEGQRGELECIGTDRNGYLSTSHVWLIPERDATGRVASVLAVGRDVTHLRQTEKQLEETQSRLASILQTIPDLIWLKNLDGTFLACNAAVERWLGAAEAQIIGRTIHDFLPKAQADAAQQRDQEVLSSGRMSVHHEWGAFADDRIEVLFETRRVPMQGPDGMLTGVLGVARDVTLQQTVSEQLASREREYRSLAENSPDTIVRYNRACQRIYVNPAYEKYSGKTAFQALGTTPIELSHVAPAAAADYQQQLMQVFETGKVTSIELDWRKDDGQRQVQQIVAVPERDRNGNIPSLLTISRDISALKAVEQRLEEAEAMAHLGHWQWDFRFQQGAVSAGICRIFAKPRDWNPNLKEVFGAVIGDERKRLMAALKNTLTHQSPKLSLDYRIQVGERIRNIYSHIHVEYDASGKPLQLMGITQDVSELRSYQQRLHSLSYYDTLTKLPNRDLLSDLAERAIIQASRDDLQVALMVLDLDHFKAVNDSLGYQMGDQVLRETARRLQRGLREQDAVARISADEFALVIADMAPDADVSAVARQALDVISQTYAIEGRELFISASIGIARYPQDGDDASSLLQFANAAMYHAKDRGRNNAQFYDAALTTRTSEQLLLTSGLRQALARGELEVYYQPQMNLADKRLVGAEALLRWKHPERGMVPPDRFIPIAEQTGLIVPIGQWVLQAACAAACSWNASRRTPLRVAVNLSPRQFKLNDLVGTVRHVLCETGCRPDWLELEITESLLLDDDGQIGCMLTELADMGISLAVDDFGTGYSALSYLNRFPISTLKIDLSFVFDLIAKPQNAALVKAILAMSHSLRMKVVAEGVEQSEHADWLLAHGCELGQGYLWGRPMPRQDFDVLAGLDARPEDIHTESMP